jgi:hypothetical protein
MIAPGTLNDLNNVMRPGLLKEALPVLHVPKTESTNDLSDSVSSTDPLKYVIDPDISSTDPLKFVVKVKKNLDIIKCSMPLCKTEGPRCEFHPFPPKNSHRRAKWQNICQLSNVEFNSHLCRHHFDESDYFIAPGTLNELRLQTGKVNRKFLKAGAFPFVNVLKNVSDFKEEKRILSSPLKSSHMSEKGNRLYCSVPQCKRKGGAGFHQFPTNPDLRAKWLNKCQLSTAKNSSRVCQFHFNKSDYQIVPGTLNDLNEVMLARLKKGAVPVLHLPKNESINDSVSSMDPLKYVVKVEENAIAPDIFQCSMPLCKTEGPKCEFHPFPAKNSERRARWLNICNLSTVPQGPKRVCRLHFNKSDYIYPRGMLNDCYLPRLKKSACPVVHFPKNESINDLSESDPSTDPLTLIVKVEENVIAPDTSNDFKNEQEKKTTLKTLKSDYVIAPGTVNALNKEMIYGHHYCSVPQCKTRGPNSLFHNFPANPDVRAKWLNICQFSKVLSNHLLCQRHFNKSDYYIAPGTFNDLNEERRPVLKSEACPSLHMPRNDSNSSTDPQRSVIGVEENAITPDINNVFNDEKIKSRPSEKSNQATKKGTRYTFHCSMPLCKTKGPGAGFHSFPTNPDLRAKWLNICQLSSAKANKHRARVCQLHFNKSDYHHYPGLLNDYYQPRLKKGSCPVVQVPKNELSVSAANTEPLTFVEVKVKFKVEVEENVIAMDTIIDSNKEVIKQRLLSSTLNTWKSDHATERPQKKRRHLYCAVPLCKPKITAGFHCFPSNPGLRAKWLNICQVSEAGNKRICHLHFDKSDYMIPPGTLNDKNEEIKPRLKPGACPFVQERRPTLKSEAGPVRHVTNNESTMSHPLDEINVMTPDKINDFYVEKIKPRLLSSTLKRPLEKSNHAVQKANLKVCIFTCSVPQCRTKGPTSQGHPFPTHPDLRTKWQNICQLSRIRSDNWVCQLHFDKCDYFNAFNFNVLNEEKPLRLNIGAFPSLHLPKNESTNSSTDQQTFVVRDVEENVIGPDTINVLNEDIKPSLEIGAFPIVLHVPNDSANDLSVDCDSSMDPLAVTVKVEN